MSKRNFTRVKLSALAVESYLVVPILVIFLVLSCTTPSNYSRPISTPVTTTSERPVVKAEWEVEWGKTLEKGRKEGLVTFYNTLGSEVRNAFNDTFPKATGIGMDFVTGNSSQIVAKIFTEGNAGLNLVDVYAGGLNTIIELKSKGYLQPIKSSLILPEVLNPDMWVNKTLPFADINKDTFFSFRANPGGWWITINTDFVKKEELSSFYDLLNPRWKGKIALNDVTAPGSGLRWFSMSVLYYGLSLDYMKQLTKQEPFMTRDERIHMEWIARGKYPIGIAASNDMVAEFKKAGAPILDISPKEEIPYISTGAGTVVLLSKTRHPNAAKVFINWLLSREGQTIFSRARQDTSARVDVPTDHLPSHRIMDPNEKYLIINSEEVLTDPRWIELQDKSKEIFAHLLK